MALIVRGQKPLSVQCCWVLHRTRIRSMRCSVVSIAWSQRAINPHNSRCVVRNTPLSTCSSNPMSSRSSMVSSNWYCNLVAKSLTRWTKRSCWSKAHGQQLRYVLPCAWRRSKLPHSAEGRPAAGRAADRKHGGG